MRDIYGVNRDSTEKFSFTSNEMVYLVLRKYFGNSEWDKKISDESLMVINVFENIQGQLYAKLFFSRCVYL